VSGDDREELRARVRSAAPLDPDWAVVIRGGPDTPALLRSHARRLHRLYVLDGQPIYGLSVFVAAHAGSAEELHVMADKLRSYPFVYRTTVGRLDRSGFALLPTFVHPHFTVLIPSLEAVDELAAAFGELLVNPYADERKEER
jgi:hypothetical protein